MKRTSTASKPASSAHTASVRATPRRYGLVQVAGSRAVNRELRSVTRTEPAADTVPPCPNLGLLMPVIEAQEAQLKTRYEEPRFTCIRWSDPALPNSNVAAST